MKTVDPAIEARLRSEICPRCSRYTAQGTCSLPSSRPCAIFRNLGDIIEIVRQTRSGRIDPYVDGVRLNVCGACPHEDDHGSCPMRDHVDCALDSYLPIVVDYLESALARETKQGAANAVPGGTTKDPSDRPSR